MTKIEIARLLDWFDYEVSVLFLSSSLTGVGIFDSYAALRSLGLDYGLCLYDMGVILSKYQDLYQDLYKI